MRRALSHVSVLSVLVAAFGVPLPYLASSGSARAENEGCVVNGSTADCPDVPQAGIRYTSHVTTVTVSGSTPGVTVVDPSRIGIELDQTGADGSDGISTTFSNTVTVKIDGKDENVVADSDNQPVLSDGYYIIVVGDNDFSINGTSYTGDALARYLAGTPDDPGETVHASLTLTHREPYPGNDGGLSTTGAYGVSVTSYGGNGGNGSCHSVLVYTWCHDGHHGGNAGSVAINNNGVVTVDATSDKRYGINAISKGGEGGDGGGAFGLFASKAGHGGAGGTGGEITINLGIHSDITTHGKLGHGVFVQSLGGNGGTGGEPSGAAALGEKGGQGGNAGAVVVANAGSILTTGEAAYGINASSIGAGAGSGSSSGGIYAVGGAGGGSSTGGVVTVRNSGSIETTNSDAFGVFVQSVGGGGGNGGSSGALVSVGGHGSSGGNGGKVEVYNSGSVKTGGDVGGPGDGSVGVFLQSVGGGGGNGGNAYSGGPSISVAVGGSGAIGGEGGTVSYNPLADGDTVADLASSSVVTTGDRSHGIQAQSVGGGGGNGGFAVAGSVGVGTLNASVSVGGSGAKGGASNAVTVNQNGLVETSGDQSIGIFAQSVGGGGGNGGGSVAASVGGSYTVGVAVGGSGGAGGASNTATVNAAGSVITKGDLSHAILAQSIGGGGGNGGFSAAGAVGGMSGTVSLGGSASEGGDGKTVVVNTQAGGEPGSVVSTAGDGSVGVFAQSIGGGGGNGGVAGSLSVGGGGIGVSLGGTGGAGGKGGEVTVGNATDVTTRGKNATAVLAQSIGGGGGNGGSSLSGSGGVIGVSVAVGGKAGGGSNGGTVNLTNHGNITTGYSVDSVVDGETVTELFGSKSYGIFAQSVGGGGGNGGYAISGALGVSIPDMPGGAAAISVGGKGGGASTGGTVTVDNYGGIETFGLDSHAIYAQSVGGGGGNGGFAGSVSMTVGSGASVGVAVGGSGGGGGDSGTVTVTAGAADTAATIVTHADGADGIHAQSVGGGGGDGGFAMSGAFGFGGEVSVDVSVAIGGPGGQGGKGGVVTVTAYQDITTHGDSSIGVMAQSIGGGGGNGGMAVSGTLAFSESAGATGVSVGGAGGDGNTANAATVDNYGAITTWGRDSIGILAQSIGGSGGNGGLAVAAQMTGTSNIGATVGVSVGGGGGTGNSAGMVTITNHQLAAILTNGYGSHAIKAQSIGGGGGNGGLAVTAQLGKSSGTEDEESKTLNVGVAVGGAGGDGGFGNTVTVTNDGGITAKGTAATGIFAQSVGGGGGDGGGGVNGIGMLTDSANESSRSVVADVTIGGNGGDGNYGGEVDVTNSGNVKTEGDSGHGIQAQSVGGGGGVGGRANTYQVIITKPEEGQTANKNNLSLAATIGGNGGTGSHGGKVKVDNSGEIETSGDTAHGIYAQSVGGGGGDGGNGTVGLGGILNLKGADSIITSKYGSLKTYKNIQVAVGGSAGSTGDGGVVEVDNSSHVTTHGANSIAILAQSVGGGGGIGGTGVSGATGLLGLGGAGGSAGNGGIVTVTQTGEAIVETFGTASHGVFAQSVGGGGGMAGSVNRVMTSAMKEGPVSVPAMNIGAGLAMGRSGGNGGDGAKVDVDFDGMIVTHGDSAAAIMAQSVGGGGGVLGDLGNITDVLSYQLGSAGDAGNAGVVTVDLTGTVKTAGNSATGIFAQSAAGTAGGAHTGEAGNVNVTVNGSVLTAQILDAEDDGTVEDPKRGLGAVGILAQSVAVDDAKNGDITVTINGADTVVAGGRSLVVDDKHTFLGVGVWFTDGDANTLANHGHITTFDGVDDGYAIFASGSDATHLGGSETVTNAGTVTGSFDLGTGVNSFTNQAGATLNFGKYAFAGAGGTVSNSGWMSPGGDGKVMSTSMTGDFTQTATGVYGVDLDLSKTSLVPVSPLMPAEADTLMSADTIAFDGAVRLSLLNIGTAKPGQHTALLARSEISLTDNGLVLDAPVSAVAKYSLSTNATDLILDYGIDFAPAGLDADDAAVGEYINRLQLAGGSAALEPVIVALFDIQDLAEYAAIIDELNPAPYLGNQIASMYGVLDFSDALLSCKVMDGPYKFNAEGECMWFAATGSSSHKSSDMPSTSFSNNRHGWRLGAQGIVSEHVRAGFGLSVESVTSNSGSLDKSAGISYLAGASLKGVFGGTVLAGTVAAGYDSYNVQRAIDLPLGPSYVDDGTQNFAYLSAHSRISHTFGSQTAYLRPHLDLGVTHMFGSDFSESGDSPLDVNVSQPAHTMVTVNTGVELGAEIATDAGSVIRPFAAAGVLFVPVGDDLGLSGTFAGEPSAEPFTVDETIDDIALDLRLGFDVVTAPGLSVRAMAGARIGETTETYSGDLKLSLPF